MAWPHPWRCLLHLSFSIVRVCLTFPCLSLRCQGGFAECVYQAGLTPCNFKNTHLMSRVFGATCLHGFSYYYIAEPRLQGSITLVTAIRCDWSSSEARALPKSSHTQSFQSRSDIASNADDSGITVALVVQRFSLKSIQSASRSVSWSFSRSINEWIEQASKQTVRWTIAQSKQLDSLSDRMRNASLATWWARTEYETILVAYMVVICVATITHGCILRNSSQPPALHLVTLYGGQGPRRSG